MRKRNYITYSADGLIVAIERHNDSIDALKEIVHEISFRNKAADKLAPHLRKAQALIAMYPNGDSEAELFRQGQKSNDLSPIRSKAIHGSLKIKNPTGIDVSMISSVKLEDLGLQEREYYCLKATGIHDLLGLVKRASIDLLKLPNFGESSLANVKRLLEGYGLTLGMAIDSFDQTFSDQGIAAIPAYNLSISEMNLTVREENCLEAEGINDLKTLVGKKERELLKIPNFGKGSLGLITSTLKDLGLSLGMQATSISWIQEEKTGHAYAPGEGNSDKNIDSAINFGDSIDLFIEQYAQALTNNSKKLIFTERIACQTYDMPTLESIGQEIGVTRERVRQIEKTVVRDLVRVVFGGHHLGGKLKFEPSFTAGWRQVAVEFEGVDEISSERFMEELVSIWDISVNDLQRYFNFVSVIFTGKVKSHLAKDQGSLFGRIVSFREKFSACYDIKISHLRLAKCSGYFADMGIFTVGDFLYSQEVFDGDSVYVKRLIDRLGEIELSDEGGLDWMAFMTRYDFRLFGQLAYQDSQDFIEKLPSLLVEMIDKLDVWKNCKEVFLYRTSKHPANRPTLKMAATYILGKPNHGPVVSRMQDHFLQKLRVVIIDKDYSNAKFWLAKGALRYFSKARELHSLANGDFDKFVYLVRARWGISDSKMDNISILWTIIDGYAPKPYFHLELGEVRKRKTVLDDYGIPDKIKLAGFRDIF